MTDDSVPDRWNNTISTAGMILAVAFFMGVGLSILGQSINPFIGVPLAMAIVFIFLVLYHYRKTVSS
jgi:hypothetical protein